MTAEEFLNQHGTISHFYSDEHNKMICFSEDIEKAMIEFAKYHVEKALEVASEKGCNSLELYNSEYETLKKSVEEAYPLDNIK